MKTKSRLVFESFLVQGPMYWVREGRWGSGFFRSLISLYRIGVRSRVPLLSIGLWGPFWNIWILIAGLVDRAPKPGPATLCQVGGLSPKKVLSSVIQDSSVLLLWRACCVRRDLSWWKDPAYEALTLGWVLEACGPYWATDSASVLHHRLMLLLPQRSVHPEHLWQSFQVSAKWPFGTSRMLGYFPEYLFLIIWVIYRHFVFLRDQGFCQPTEPSIYYVRYSFMDNKVALTIANDFSLNLFLKDLWL